MGVVKKLVGGGSSPAAPVAAPVAPTAAAPAAAQAANTSAAVTAQATPQTGRAANIVAGADPSLSAATDDPFSVRKKLLGY